MIICKNCSTDIVQNYCSNCGQPAQLKRIDGHYLAHEMEHILHFERGILYTIRELLTNPGKNIKNYLIENRSRLVKPIIFVIVTSLIYSFISHFFHIEQEYIQYMEVQKSATGSIFKWIQAHYGYANIIMGICIAFWTKLFFRKHGYNLFEILILMCFIMGMTMLILAVFSIPSGIFHIDILQFGGMVCLVYTIWAMGQFFDKSKISAYLKSLLAYFLGMISFGIIAILIGVTVDLLFKH